MRKAKSTSDGAPAARSPRASRTKGKGRSRGAAEGSAANPRASGSRRSGAVTPHPGLARTRAPKDPPPGARAPAAEQGVSVVRGGKAGARSTGPAKTSPPEELLHRAMTARTPRARAIWARKGLATRAPLDRTTQAMLLRQLYLAHFEGRRFREACEVSEQILETGVLPDVAHQDAARAYQALGDVDRAASHLRLAARVSPAKRKAFHWWTLGSVYFLARRYDEAQSALARAARWGTTDKPLYQGHLAVAQCAAGAKVPDLSTLIEKLAGVPAGQGYGRFVLGQMAYYDRRWEEARRHLEAFVRRSTSGRTALAIALDGEIEVARRTLASIASG